MAKTQKGSSAQIAELKASLSAAHGETEAAEEKLRHSLARESSSQRLFEEARENLQEVNDSLEETRIDLQCAERAVSRLEMQLAKAQAGSEGKAEGIIEGCAAMLSEVLDRTDI